MVDRIARSSSPHTALTPRGTAPRGIGVAWVRTSSTTEASASSRLTAQLDQATRVAVERVTGSPHRHHRAPAHLIRLSHAKPT